ncbi:F-box protein At4g00755-like [Andrographis paniculata]|uniref:F-box protein At4g00755-like n=1 Tax=Andrographis paniculata TaxID=175694 RepID=UPI0021E78DA6|nr:F-box protein At4g00755-like [Andrographis paniculata]
MLKNTSYCDAIMDQGKKHHLPRFNDLRKEHKLYSSLLAILSKASMINPENCIGFVIGTSSTSHYIGKSIIHALLPNQMYWSSKGHTDANVSDTILFKLKGGVCIVSDIQIQPSRGHYGNRQYIFSAMSVQFSMGHRTLPRYQTHQDINLPGDMKDDHFVWGYTSPQFPMEQSLLNQTFTLPEPVLCVGGILKIELLGMVQRDPRNNLYYHCLHQVSIRGQSLEPPFDIKTVERGELILRHQPSAVIDVLRQIPLPSTATLSQMAVAQRMEFMFNHLFTLLDLEPSMTLAPARRCANILLGYRPNEGRNRREDAED